MYQGKMPSTGPMHILVVEPYLPRLSVLGGAFNYLVIAAPLGVSANPLKKKD